MKDENGNEIDTNKYSLSIEDVISWASDIIAMCDTEYASNISEDEANLATLIMDFWEGG